jgi:hypothetical protein
VQLLQVLPVSATPSDREQNAFIGDDPHFPLHGAVLHHPRDLLVYRLPQFWASESRLFDTWKRDDGLLNFL